MQTERHHAPRVIDPPLSLGCTGYLAGELRAIGLEGEAADQEAAARDAVSMRLDQVPAAVIEFVDADELRDVLPRIHRSDADGDDTCSVIATGSRFRFRMLVTQLERAGDELPAGALRESAARLADVVRWTFDGFDRDSFTLHLPNASKLTLDCRRPAIMGVLNVTPDSFSDGGQFIDAGAAVAHAHSLVSAGVDILDVGGESTRPGAAEVSADDEQSRVVPVIERLAQELTVPISIDSTKAAVVQSALDSGASIINDVSGLPPGSGLGEIAARYRAPVICMHMQGTPRTMQQDPQYDDLMADLCAFFRERTARLMELGVARDQVVIDPGFGFGKTHAHNLELVRRLREFRSLGQPILVGISRKSMLGRITGADVDDRMPESLAVHLVASLAGAHAVRVHDVRETRKVMAVREALASG